MSLGSSRLARGHLAQRPAPVARAPSSVTVLCGNTRRGGAGTEPEPNPRSEASLRMPGCEAMAAARVASVPPGQGGASSANAACTRGHHDDSGSMTSKCPAPGNSSSATSSPAARARPR